VAAHGLVDGVGGGEGVVDGVPVAELVRGVEVDGAAGGGVGDGAGERLQRDALVDEVVDGVDDVLGLAVEDDFGEGADLTPRPPLPAGRGGVGNSAGGV
jgi:hypothetical protein